MHSSIVGFINKKLNIDGRYFIHGGFWLGLGQIVTLLSGLATTALFAHYLSPNDFGVYKYLIGLSAILASFSLTGLGQSILQAAAKKHYAFFKETFQLNFIYSLGISFISVCFSLYYSLNNNAALALGCLMIAALQPVINTFQFIPSFLQGSRQFKQSTKLHTIRMSFITLLSLGALLFTQNILILFFTYLFSYAITNIGSIFFYNYSSDPTPTVVREKFVAYAKHSSFRNVISIVAQRADSIVIFTQLGATELAVYSIAMVIPEQIKGSFKNLATLVLPKYSRHEDQSIIKKGLTKRSLQLLVVLLIITALYIFLSPFLFKMIFPKYASAILYSQILALSLPAMVALLPVSALQAGLAERKLYKLLIIESIASLSFLFFFVMNYGLIGAIFAKVCTRYVTSFFNYYYIYK